MQKVERKSRSTRAGGRERESEGEKKKGDRSMSDVWERARKEWELPGIKQAVPGASRSLLVPREAHKVNHWDDERELWQHTGETRRKRRKQGELFCLLVSFFGRRAQKERGERRYVYLSSGSNGR